MTLSSTDIMDLITDEYGDDLSYPSNTLEGICYDCGHIQSEVEPDACGYQCEACGEFKVHGIELAVIMHA